jgi:hypothetical protein
MKIEYRVRSVIRYTVTRYHSGSGGAGIETIGEYPQHDYADRVGRLMAQAESAKFTPFPAHKSDCAIHSGPAYNPAMCDCGAEEG